MIQCKIKINWIRRAAVLSEILDQTSCERASGSLQEWRYHKELIPEEVAKLSRQATWCVSLFDFCDWGSWFHIKFWSLKLQRGILSGSTRFQSMHFQASTFVRDLIFHQHQHYWCILEHSNLKKKLLTLRTDAMCSEAQCLAPDSQGICAVHLTHLQLF